jgi:V8-like Glu-specific endopeptidase
MTSDNNSHGDKPAHARQHRSRFRRAAVATGLAAGVALLCAAVIPASAATAATTATGTTTGATLHASGVSGHATASPGDAVSAAKRTVAYWTRARMLSALNGASVTLKSVSDSHAAPASVRGSAGHVTGTGADQALAGPLVRIPARVGRGVKPDSGSIGSSWTGSFYSPPATTTGRVFFTTYNGQNWSCSGSTVNSAGKDSVITAGHCVFGSLGGEVPGEGWHSNWMFVPDYYNGYAPYGAWTAKQLWTPTNYYYNQDEGDDIGGAVINTNAYGQHIVNVVGGQGFAWNWSANQYVYDFGYPVAAPFNGQTLQYCNGSEFNWASVASTMGLACNFTGGSSGGPWLMDFNGEFGYINGVNDFVYTSLPGYIFSAYFGNNADALYNAMANL